jgi:hypothetical protein
VHELRRLPAGVPHREHHEGLTVVRGGLRYVHGLFALRRRLPGGRGGEPASNAQGKEEGGPKSLARMFRLLGPRKASGVCSPRDRDRDKFVPWELYP